MIKKLISCILVLSIVLSNGFVFTTHAAIGMENFTIKNQYKANHFTDVPSSAWYAENVKTAYELGLVNGSGVSSFAPNSNITLAETITLASRLNNIYNGSTYTFVTSGVWYQTYVDYAVRNNIIKSNEYTNLNAYATRAQFAQILASALPDVALNAINQIPSNSIPDVSMQSLCFAAVYKLYRAGILTGNDSIGTFTPNAYIQRNAVSAIVSRMAMPNMRVLFTLNEAKSILPPQNIRIVDQKDSSVYIQWDEVPGADYYYFYFQEDGDEYFWYDEDQSTGEKLKFSYSPEYSSEYRGLESGKRYNIKVSSVKNGIESDTSETFSFDFYNMDQQSIVGLLRYYVNEYYTETISGVPVYAETLTDEYGSTMYSIRYVADSDAIMLEMHKIYNDANTFVAVGLTSDYHEVFLRLSHYKPHNLTDTSDFTGSCLISARDINENYNVTFSKINNDIKDPNYSYEQMGEYAKFAMLDLLKFCQYVIVRRVRVEGSPYSVADFGIDIDRIERLVNLEQAINDAHPDKRQTRYLFS